jgi:hypothetical protein
MQQVKFNGEGMISEEIDCNGTLVASDLHVILLS